MRSKLACVIVNYNDWKRTINLSSLIVNYQCIDHVIIIDNCSSDDSYQRLSELNNSKIILIKSDRNGGYGYGNNIGIKKAIQMNDEYVLIANPDTDFTENCILNLLDTLKKHPECAIITAKEKVHKVYGWKYTSGLHDVLSTSIFLNKLFKKRYYKKSYFENKEISKVDIVPGCFLLTKTAVMQQIGYYDEDFFLYEEEKVLYKKINEIKMYSLIDLRESYQHNHVSKGKTIKQYINTKNALIDSKIKFLKKYRHFNRAQMFLSVLFMLLTKIEMFIYAVYLSFK